MLYQKENPHGGDIYGRKIQLDFSANTNPLGTPPGVLAAIEGALPQLHRYPDPYCRALVQAIGDFEQLPRERILCGSGAAELIYAYCRSLGPVRGVELAPTFSEYSTALMEAGGRMERYVLKKENGFLPGEDFLPFLAEKKPDVVFLCNPNNPTGRTVPEEQMEKIVAFCREKEIRMFVDECFLDLSDGGKSVKHWMKEWKGLFILKAFTKSYGLAGVRLGYGLSSDGELLSRMAAAVPPWNVSTIAQAAGVAALRERDFLRETKALIRRERPKLQAGLEKLGFWACPSETNYLLFQATPELGRLLEEQGITIRSCANFHGLGPGWYRTAVRTEAENARLLEAMGKALQIQDIRYKI